MVYLGLVYRDSPLCQYKKRQSAREDNIAIIKTQCKKKNYRLDFYPADICKSPGTKTHGKTEPSLNRIIISVISNSIFSSVTRGANALLGNQAVFLFGR